MIEKPKTWMIVGAIIVVVILVAVIAWMFLGPDAAVAAGAGASGIASFLASRRQSEDEIQDVLEETEEAEAKIKMVVNNATDEMVGNDDVTAGMSPEEIAALGDKLLDES